MNYLKQLKIIKGYVNNETTRNKPRYDLNEAGVDLIDTGKRKPRRGRDEGGQDMCRDPKH